MTVEQTGSDFFTAGGTLPPDAPSYVTRPTDEELFHHIMIGEFCYVLTPRQMGKSSLMIRTEQRLKSEGVRSAIVDLTVTGTVESEDQWYKGILTQVKRRLRTSIDPVQWWEEKKDIPNIQKFIDFFEEILTEVPERVVIFMDEIDTTLKLDFRDDFFAGIRAIFNARAENPALKRLTFVLLGVASPSDLIKDRNRTPFNIGQEIPLRPFSRENARMLEAGLEEVYPGFGKKILDRIFYWTNGHPYLTQKLCQNVVETPLKEYDDNEIDLLVKNLFTSDEASRETNLQFVRDNVLNYPERRVILSLYKKLLRGIEVRDNKNSLPQNHLKLSGLARADDGKLVVSNKIYRKVFDQRWVNRYTEIDWRYVIIGVLSLIVLGFAFVFYNDSVRLPNRAARMVNDVLVHKDEQGIRSLANLFRMEPVIFANQYEYMAKDIFFNTYSTWENQKSLIEITYGEHHPPPEDYKIVVTGLYTSLADVDNSGQTTRLLEVMQSSMKEMGMQNEDIYKEVGYWLEARKKAKDSDSNVQNSLNDLQDALTNYNEAIKLNLQNPATLFERARIYARLTEYGNALKDYDQVLAIVPTSDIEPTAIPTSEISARTSTPLGQSTASATLTGSPVSTPNVQETAVIETAIAESALSIRPIVTPVESTPITPLFPIQPRFLTLGQRVVAVNNDIEQNPLLSSFLSKANSTDYPNLESKGLIPTVSPVTVTVVPPSACDKAEFIADITIPDGSLFAPGATFTKTWRFKNVGTCPWTTSYQLVFSAGNQMGAPASLAFPQNVAAGQTIDISVNLTAPSTAGSYIGYWIFKNAKGVLFGIGSDGNRPWWVDIKVSALTPTPGGPTDASSLSTPTLGIGPTRIRNDGMTLIYVPAGEFTMGSDNGDTDEKPAHAVYLDAFWIDKTEVTNAMYLQCVDAGLCNIPTSTKSYTRDSYFGNALFDNYPVIYISWDDANAYCSWAGSRLPTEAEWEKAARGENAFTYPWGNASPNNNLVNYSSAVGDTTGVGDYPEGASPYGALNMAGNVWEWVADWYSESYYQISSPTNPLGPDSGQFRAVRGGAWNDIDSEVRAANRNWKHPPSNSNYQIGFRCAMSVTP